MPYLVGSKIGFLLSHTSFSVVPTLGSAHSVLEVGTVSLFSLIVLSPAPRWSMASRE